MRYLKQDMNPGDGEIFVRCVAEEGMIIGLIIM